MIAYGYDLPENDNTFVDVVRATMPQFSAGFLPGAHLVDLVPLCMCYGLVYVNRSLLIHTVQYVPSWIPGMEWKRSVETWKHDLNAQLETPYQYAKQEIVSLISRCYLSVDRFDDDVPWQAKGNTFPSFVFSCLGESPDAEREELVKAAAASLYLGTSAQLRKRRNFKCSFDLA